MVKIARIIETGGDTITVELDNGSIVILDMECLMRKPPFNALREDERIRYPHIEDGGEAIYWRNGPRMTVNEIVLFLENGDKII